MLAMRSVEGQFLVFVLECHKSNSRFFLIKICSRNETTWRSIPPQKKELDCKFGNNDELMSEMLRKNKIVNGNFSCLFMAKKLIT